MSNVYLVGMMGAGKTTTGKSLASRLGLGFLDLDTFIALNTGLEPADWIQSRGEEAFRDAEFQALKIVANLRCTVVATGGGTPLYPGARELMQDTGTVLWLDAPAARLWKRVHSSNNRPLAACENAFLGLYQERRPVYAAAGQRVDASSDPDRVVQAIMEILKRTTRRFHLSPPLQVVGRAGSYPVLQLSSVAGAGERLSSMCPGPFLVVAPPLVFSLYGEELRRGLESAGAQTSYYLIPDGEENKNLDTVGLLYQAFADRRFPRTGTVVALGGGVTGDVAGFAAATYQRGTGLAHVPTTLLAQVDSSVGGKTGVNLPQGKNLVGAFYAPVASLLVPRVVTTLPPAVYRQGLAEVAKCALLAGEEFLCWLEQHAAALATAEPGAVSEAVYRSCRLKADLVSQDELDRGVRRWLNLGHTLAHALEAASGYSLAHGDAVAAGLVWAADLSELTGRAAPGLSDRVRVLLDRLGLPLPRPPVSAGDLLSYMELDKKRDQGGLQLVLLDAPGQPVVTNAVTTYWIRAALDRLQEVVS
ncbi:MAG: 3-dehydroquinate synthase [Bacillota bacterium]